MKKKEIKQIIEKVVLEESVIKFNATPNVGDKFDLEKFNYANKLLNGMNTFIYDELVKRLNLK